MADEGVAPFKTLQLKILAIPSVYGSGRRRRTSRLNAQDRSLRAKIRYGLPRINAMKLLLFNSNAMVSWTTVEARRHGILAVNCTDLDRQRSEGDARLIHETKT